MPKIVECVPNFSEGRSKEVIDAIADSIASTDGCTLLDIDPGQSTNRTVYTFVGSPDDVVKGALAGALCAFKLIDMSKHSGEHHRLGALDVCPFIPVQDVTMEECVECAKQFAAKLSSALQVPVYLYGYASAKDHRKSVPQIREGQYEGLAEKLTKSEWEPDFGPAEFVSSWGATIAGARNFLIAYNVNMLSTKEQANRIAMNIREKGRGPDQPGRLKNVQAMGWYLEESNIAQVSVNITDISTTPMHVVYEECCKDAKELSLSVVGSEVVGLLPKCCLLEAAEFYIKKENLFLLEEEQKIRLAINRLGLHSIKYFDPKEKIIEFLIKNDGMGAHLINLSVKDFVFSVGSRTAVPGGGSVAALIGSLGSGLGAMASLLSYGNRRFQPLDATMRTLIPALFQGYRQMLPIVDADSSAFHTFMEVSKMPEKTEDEASLKYSAKKNALMQAIQVPMSLAKGVSELWTTLKELAPLVNINCKSDLQVGVRCLQTAVWGAYYNVMTNVRDVDDEAQKKEVIDSIEMELTLMQHESESILKMLDSRE